VGNLAMTREITKKTNRKLQIVIGRTWYDAPPIFSLRDVVIRGSEQYGDRPAVRWRVRPRDHEIVTKSYSELSRDVARVQAWLGERLPRGSRIALIGDNSYAWMVTWLAVASGFGVIVPLDRLLQPQELIPCIQRSQTVMLIYDYAWHQRVESMLDDFPLLKYRAAMDRGLMSDDESRAFRACMAEDEMLLLLDDALETPLEDSTVATHLLEPEDVEDDAAILFTSGTSATSKAVILTNKSIAADIRALRGSVYFGKYFKSLSILPLHHAFENTCGFLTVLSFGGTIHISDGLRYIGNNFAEHKVHLTVVVPAVLDAIHRRVINEARRTGQLKKLQFGIFVSTLLYKLGIDRRRVLMKDVLDKLGGNLKWVICGAAPVERSTLKFFRAIGIEVLAGYGLTEASPVVGGGNTKVNPFGTVGQPLSGVEVAIDNGGKRGQPGEILVRSDIIMKGYLNDPEATAEAIDGDGWLHTADIGYFTRKDGLIITGRSKSMIVLASGKKVFPEELELLINRHEIVRDSLVFGHEGASGDIVITAKIVIDEDKWRNLQGAEATEEDVARSIKSIIDEVNRNLPSFKSVRSYFYSFKDMVKTTTLKVRRGVELQKIEELFAKTKISWQTLRGQNIDSFIEKYVHGGSMLPAEDKVSRTADRKMLMDMRSERREMERARRKLQKRRNELERRKKALHMLSEKLEEVEECLVADELAFKAEFKDISSLTGVTTIEVPSTSSF
jgi:long-chain acyl-CoA synthetase